MHLSPMERRARIAGLLRAEFARLDASAPDKLAFLRSELARYFRRIDTLYYDRGVPLSHLLESDCFSVFDACAAITTDFLCADAPPLTDSRGAWSKVLIARASLGHLRTEEAFDSLRAAVRRFAPGNLR